MNAWLWVGVIVMSTTIADVLQSIEMKRHGEVEDFRPSAFARLIRRPLLLLSIGAMAVSFFSFLALLSVADLSFAVPATAASFVVETILAKFLLKENVDARRWTAALLVACGVALLAV